MQLTKIIKKFFLFTSMIIVTASILHATTVQANSQEIDENLNLEAIASLFAEAKDLEDFEMKLNNPKLQISNIDLNQDGNVDYLRVIETTEKNLHLIVIQAVLAKDTYQDIATIEADKTKNQTETLQIVGDPYIYGDNYIIEPEYTTRPPIFAFFWLSLIYHSYHSHYHWGYYPPHFHYWHPRPPYFYHKHIHNHINKQHHYKRTKKRRSPIAKQLHNKVKKNDFAIRHPEQSYIKRVAKRSIKKPISSNPAIQQKPTHKPTMRPKPVVKPKPVIRPVAKPIPSIKPVISHKPMIRPILPTRPIINRPSIHSTIKPRPIMRAK
jgi:hypothetical protein